MIDYTKYAKFPEFVVSKMKTIEKMYSNSKRYERFVFNEIYISPEHSRNCKSKLVGPSALVTFSVLQHTLTEDDGDVMYVATHDDPVRVYSFAYITPETFLLASMPYCTDKFFTQHYALEDDEAKSFYEKDHRDAYIRGHEDGYKKGYHEGRSDENYNWTHDSDLEEEMDFYSDDHDSM